MSGYYLSKHVFLCSSGGQLILLDLKNDRYIALDATCAGPLAEVVPGWPTPKGVPTTPAPTPGDAVDAFVQTMVARNLLTTDRKVGKDATPIAIAVPTRSLVDDEGHGNRMRVRFDHVRRFALAATGAALMLRGPIERVVTRVQQRRERERNASLTGDVQARALVGAFNRLRPFAFTAHNACLFDSLALLNFLSAYGIYPNWVFGVHTAPFAAHCWVQHDNTVFNDSLDHVTQYTPIMTA